jgi:hypothetical protein
MGTLLTREEVHCLVWSRPAVFIAAMLGISSGSLARSCKRRGIPMPDRGYWQRLKAGQVLSRLPLELVETELPMPWACTPELERLLAEFGLPRLAPPASVAELGSAAGKVQVEHDSIGLVKTPPKDRPKPDANEARPMSQAGPDDLWQGDDAPIVMARIWLAREQELASLERLCVQLEGTAQDQPAAVRAAMRAWVATIREHMDAMRPIAGFIGLCNRLAEGREVRTWWPTRKPRT